ncbi:hypothetical protein Q7P35_007452 [Cladosporium inversicolor]
MSFQRLANIVHTNATAYPQPITARRITDENDTESSEESDDDSEHLLDYNARVLRRRHVQARARNRLQPVQDLANGIAERGDHLYNDVVRLFFDEAVFRIHVVVLTIGRLLLILFWSALEGLWWTIWSTSNMIVETILTFFYLVGTLFIFGLQTLIRVSLAIPLILRDAPWYMLKAIPVAVVLALVITGSVHGFMRTTIYICSEPSLIKEWTGISDACNQTQIVVKLHGENMELIRLVHASNATLGSISGMAATGNLNANPGFRLMTESTALVQFVAAHKESLAPFSKRQDLVAVANAVYTDVTALNKAAEKFTLNHRIQLEELEIKAHRMLADAKKFKAHSPYERFFLESASHLLPSTFSYTGAARQASRYAGFTRHIVESKQTIAILQQAKNVQYHMEEAEKGMNITKEAISKYEPYWNRDCQGHANAEVSGHIDCGVVDPSVLNKRLAKVLEEAKAAAQTIDTLYTSHRRIKNAMTDLRSRLILLLKIAAGKTVDSGKTIQVDAPSARAILHQFVREVGALDLLIGSGSYDVGMGLGCGVAMGSKHIELPDGRIVPHLEKYVNHI